MDITYKYEPHSSAALRVIVIVVILIGICVIFTMKQPRDVAVAAYVPHNRYGKALDTSVVFVCIDESSQLENVGLTIAGAPPRYFNVPVNPTLIEATLDGFMAQKVSVAGRDIYKIQLPLEDPVVSISLDMTVHRPQSVYIFLENMEGRRIWEKNVKVSEGRYHRVDINAIKYT